MNEVIGLIRDLARAVRELHEGAGSDNFRSRQLLAQLETIEKRADSLLPERPSGPSISPDRSQAEWDALVNRPMPRIVKNE